jgi:hypothetical protein
MPYRSDRANPQHIIDQIDALVNESLERGPTDDYERDWLARCELCGADWHGLTDPDGCPGAFATPAQRDAWADKPGLDDIAALIASDDFFFLGAGGLVLDSFAAARDLILDSFAAVRVHRCHQCQRYLGAGATLDVDSRPIDGRLYCYECAAMCEAAALRAIPDTPARNAPQTDNEVRG